MTGTRVARIGLSVALVGLLVGGLLMVMQFSGPIHKTRLTAYFDNSTGIYPGDQVRILGVPVGKIETIEPQPQRAKVTFWVDGKYKVPADAKAVIISPTVVTARFIQLTPVYTAGPEMPDNAVIPKERTAVPVEWDDLRVQLEKLNNTLQPTQPGGVSTLGAFVTTVADNLRGQGASIRDSVIKLSQALSILGDRSGDLFGTLKNLAVLVSALANDPNEVGTAVADLNTAVADTRGFLAENRDTLGTTFDKLAEITKALGDSSGDLKQALHVFPNTAQNYLNIWEPTADAITGGLSGNNFSNPISFICGAIQAASRLGAEQSAKLCVQYLAPILKNRQYNFLGPLGFNGAPLPVPPFFIPVLPVGEQARPNEVTYSEDWMRPDYVPPAAPPSPEPATAPTPQAPLAAEAPIDGSAGSPPPVSTDPAAGLPGMMVPSGAGS